MRRNSIRFALILLALGTGSTALATPHLGAAPFVPPTSVTANIKLTSTCDAISVEVCRQSGSSSNIVLNLGLKVRGENNVWATLLPPTNLSIPQIGGSGSCTHVVYTTSSPGYLHKLVLPIDPTVSKTIDVSRLATVSLSAGSIPMYTVTTPSGMWVYYQGSTGTFNIVVPACAVNPNLEATGTCSGLTGSACIGAEKATTRVVKAYRVHPVTGAILGFGGEVFPTIAAVNRCPGTKKTLDFAFPINGTNNLIPGDTVRLVMHHRSEPEQFQTLRAGTSGPLVTTVKLLTPGLTSCLLDLPPQPF